MSVEGIAGDFIDETPKILVEEQGSLSEVARRLGISVDTVRRRVKDGTFEEGIVPSRHGPTWQVKLGLANERLIVAELPTVE